MQARQGKPPDVLPAHTGVFYCNHNESNQMDQQPPVEKAFHRDMWCHIGAVLRREHLDWSSILYRISWLLHNVPLRVFAHTSYAEKHFIDGEVIS